MSVFCFHGSNRLRPLSSFLCVVQANASLRRGVVACRVYVFHDPFGKSYLFRLQAIARLACQRPWLRSCVSLAFVSGMFNGWLVSLLFYGWNQYYPLFCFRSV